VRPAKKGHAALQQHGLDRLRVRPLKQLHKGHTVSPGHTDQLPKARMVERAQTIKL
jgi:hypothetical protein